MLNKIWNNSNAACINHGILSSVINAAWITFFMLCPEWMLHSMSHACVHLTNSAKPLLLGALQAVRERRCKDNCTVMLIIFDSIPWHSQHMHKEVRRCEAHSLILTRVASWFLHHKQGALCNTCAECSKGKFEQHHYRVINVKAMLLLLLPATGSFATTRWLL